MENCGFRYADVRVRCDDVIVSVPVTSLSKPVVSSGMKDKWQKFIDMTARCMDIPAALIMQIGESDISVFISSRSKDNPYKTGDREELKHGLYCETVLGKDAPLYIADAMDSAYWFDNPDIKLGMKSYFGFPLKWPDGEFFGTICVLDSIENPYMQSYADMVVLMRQVIEKDLAEMMYGIEKGDAEFSALQKKIESLNSDRTKLMMSVYEKRNFISQALGCVKTGLSALSEQASLKAYQNGGKETAVLMKDMTARMDTLICMVDTLCCSGSAGAIPVGVYIREISDKIKAHYSADCVNISFGIDIPDYLALDAESAVSCGSIVTEVVINSIKHAFKHTINGEIYIMIRENRPGEYMMHIADNGTGFHPAKNNGNGTGLEFINYLVNRIQGTIRVACDKGTSYFIEFKKRQPENPPDFSGSH